MAASVLASDQGAVAAILVMPVSAIISSLTVTAVAARPSTVLVVDGRRCPMVFVFFRATGSIADVWINFASASGVPVCWGGF